MDYQSLVDAINGMGDKGQALRRQADPNSDATMNSAMQAAMGTVGAPEGAAEGLLPRLKAMLGTPEATAGEALNASTAPASGASLAQMGTAADANSRALDQIARNSQQYAAIRAAKRAAMRVQ